MKEAIKGLRRRVVGSGCAECKRPKPVRLVELYDGEEEPTGPPPACPVCGRVSPHPHAVVMRFPGPRPSGKEAT